MKNQFEHDIDEANAIIQWCADNVQNLNYQEMMIFIAAHQELAEKLRPIYNKYNSIKFTYKPGGRK